MRELGAETPPSRRSSPPARTAPCRTPSPASARSRAGELVVCRHGRDASTATAPTARAPSPPATSTATRARSTSWCAPPRQAALEAIGRASAARDADAVAREPIEAAGHGEHFGHGLGHGVGLEVHEAPRLSQRRTRRSRSGDVVTVEPGVYLPGRFGVRIEDLVMVTDDGCRNLSTFPKDLLVVA